MKVFTILRSNLNTSLVWVKKYSITIACLALFSLASIVVLWPKITVKVPAGYLGVIFRPLGGGVIEDQIAYEGINIKWPWTIITNYSVQIQNHSINLEVLTADLMKTKVKVTFQYEVNPTTLPILHKYIGEKYLESIVVPEVISVTRGLIAGFRSDQAYTSNILSLQNDMSININKLILEKIVANRQEWFDDDDKSMDKATATASYSRLFRPSIKYKKNKTTKEAYPPCIDPKVNFIDGVFQCNCFNMNREKIDKPMDKISLKKSTGEGIIRLTNFYIQQANCGPTWTLMRLRADETAALSDFGFIDVDEDEDVPTKKNVVIQDLDDEDNESEKTTITKSSTKEIVENDDDDEDGNAEDDEEPEPVPVVVKKASTKTPAKASTAKGANK